MRKHQLRVVTADGAHERKVDGAERLLLKAGGTLLSWKVSDLGTVIVDELGAGARIQIVDSEGKGQYRRIAPSGRFELGEERWQVGELMAFELTRIPEPAEEPVLGPPSRSGGSSTATPSGSRSSSRLRVARSAASCMT